MCTTQYIDEHLDPRLYTIQSATNSILHGTNLSYSIQHSVYTDNLRGCKQSHFEIYLGMCPNTIRCGRWEETGKMC